MKIIALNGSPRPGGNTEVLLNEAIKGIRASGFDVRIFNLNQMDIKPCQDCGGCDNTGICVINDSMSEIYEAIRKADRIILVSPVFFFGLSAQTKGMIDRCQSFWCEKYRLKKPIVEGHYRRKGLLIVVGGMMKDIGIRCSEASAKAFFRTISIPEHDTLSALGIDAKGAIFEHPDIMEKAYQAGQKLVSV